MAETQAKISTTRTLLAGAGAVAGMLLILLLLIGLLRSTREAPAPLPAGDKTPEQKLAAVQADRLTVDSYGWADRPSGLVRIPVDQAIQKLIHSPTPATLPSAPSTQPAPAALPAPAQPASGAAPTTQPSK